MVCSDSGGERLEGLRVTLVCVPPNVGYDIDIGRLGPQ
jgi:hypothetical protein